MINRSLLQRTQQRILTIENGLLVLLLTGMILLATLQIVLRNGWSTGLSWADPALRVAVLWITLLGAMAATRDNNHIKIDLLARFLPAQLKSYMQLATDLFSAFICGLLAWHGGRFVYFEWQDGSILFASVPAWACELIIPLGFGVMALRFLLSALLQIRPQGMK
ncbi:MAG: TRAP transporter small permease [Candidatus Polarisedimenticolaceae bacterium]|nr:TRAP transporter small permease [Candidatus Polarisedimenticolaceae bacterium]